MSGRGVAFRTLGCKVNQVESDRTAAALLGVGIPLVTEDEAAVVVVNTCTVTGEADRKARKELARQMVEGPPGPQRTAWNAAETALTMGNTAAQSCRTRCVGSGGRR